MRTLGAKLQLLSDKIIALDRKEGRVFMVRSSEQIRKRHRHHLFRLVAFAYFRTPARRVVAELKRAGNTVLLSNIEDRRVNEGRYIPYGIWVKVKASNKR